MLCYVTLRYATLRYAVLRYFILTTDRLKKLSVTLLENVFSAIQIDFLVEKYLNEEITFALTKWRKFMLFHWKNVDDSNMLSRNNKNERAILLR